MSHKKLFIILIFAIGVITQATQYNLGGFWKGPGTPVPEWTWMTGTKNMRDELPVYGTIGVADAANNPGARDNFTTWTDNTSRLWMYGGNGYDVNSDYGRMGDLWMYDPVSGHWTWVAGPQLAYQNPVHGTINVSSPTNSPGARAGALSWVDQSNNILWMFGGEAASGGFMADLWRYNISTGQWTWVHGPDTANNGATLGTIGVPATTNNPSSRGEGATWMDGSGNLWLFGGRVYGNLYNDLWRYNPATDEWTWFKGNSNSFNNPSDGPAVYGTLGAAAAANTPGGREFPKGWVDLDGNLWLFGGAGFDTNGDYGLMNDFWMYDVSANEWAWMSGDNIRNQNSVPGTLGVPSVANKIGAKVNFALWEDASGLVWIFGGRTYGTSCEWESNDLWTYNSTNNEVAWRAGGTNCQNTNTPGTKGVASTSNYPSSRFYGLGFWQNNSSNLFYFYGGSGVDTNNSSGRMSDLWRFNPTNGEWTWLTGSVENPINLGTYGTLGVESAIVQPGARAKTKMVSTDDGYIWLFGGEYYSSYYGYFAPSYGSLMRFNPATDQWTWMKGTQGLSGSPVFGTKGIADNANMPEALKAHSMIKDSSGRIWVFGGRPSHIYTDVGTNNLWMYNPSTNQWTWVTGNGSTYDQNGVYGTLGVPNSANTPGARTDAAMAADSNGNLWLFGGWGYGASGGADNLNDLWRFDTNTNQWTWVSGSSTATRINGNYGTLNVESPSNIPGSREHSYLWVDTNNNLFLHGGVGYDSVNNYTDRLADTWRFNTVNNQWTWIHGPNTTPFPDTATVWGTQGVFSPANRPGAREQGVSFQERGGYFWLMGGYTTDSAAGWGGYPSGMDLWKFDPVSQQWACAYACSDNDLNAQFSSVGMGISDPSNRPGFRDSSGGTIDRFGTIWIYGNRFDPGAMFWRYR